MSNIRYQSLLANLSNRVRKETLNGRAYLVTDARLIVPGVLNGSQGPLYYPASEIATDPQAWNGMPLVNGHPTITVDGQTQHISARDPTVLSKSWMGYLFNAHLSDGSDGEKRTSDNAHLGSLEGEAWFDVSATRSVSPSILNALLENKPIEISTGLFLDQEDAPRGATYNGEVYSHVARNYRPDHIAILSVAGNGEIGACSNEDGCGINVNKNKEIENCGGEGGTPGPCPSGGGDKGGGTSDKDKGKGAAKGRGKAKADSPAQVSAKQYRAKETEADNDVQAKGAKVREVQSELDAYRVGINDDGEAQLKSDRWGAQAKGKIKELLSLRKDARGEADSARVKRDEYRSKAEKYEASASTGNVSGGNKVSVKTKPNKSATIQWLTSNCKCWKGKGADLAKMPESHLNTLKSKEQRSRVLNHKLTQGYKLVSLIVNTLKTSNQDEVAEGPAKVDTGELAKFFGVDVDPAQDPSGFITALIEKLDMVRAQLSPTPPPSPAEAPVEPAASQDEEMPMEEEVPPLPEEEEMAAAQEEEMTEEEKEEETSNQFGRKTPEEIEEDKRVEEEIKRITREELIKAGTPKTNKRMTENQFMAMAPPSIQAAIKRGIEADKRERTMLINRLTANTSTNLKKSRVVFFSKKPTTELRILASTLSQMHAPTNNEDMERWGSLVGNESADYTGVEGYSPAANSLDDEVLPTPSFSDYKQRKSR